MFLLLSVSPTLLLLTSACYFCQDNRQHATDKFARTLEWPRYFLSCLKCSYYIIFKSSRPVHRAISLTDTKTDRFGSLRSYTRLLRLIRAVMSWPRCCTFSELGDEPHILRWALTQSRPVNPANLRISPPTFQCLLLFCMIHPTCVSSRFIQARMLHHFSWTSSSSRSGLPPSLVLWTSSASRLMCLSWSAPVICQPFNCVV